MCPDGDLGFTPGEQDVGMMALLFGDGSGFVDEVEGGLEVGKGEDAGDVVLVDDVPVGELMAEAVELLAMERGYATTAGDAGFGS